MPDVFPSDLLGEIRALQKRVETLEAMLSSRPALAEASNGWILRAMSSPDTSGLDMADVWIFAQGGRLVARGASGAEVDLLPQLEAAGAVANPPNFTSGTASGDDATVVNQLRADAAGTKIALDNLLSSLRLAGHLQI